MHIVQNFELIIWCCFLLIILSFAEDNEDADVIKHCMNSTNSTSCILTYEHVYKSLTKNENSFNISHALYPEGGKPSFLVRVNVYGPNKTYNSTPAKFIWSIHCLFSNVPALLLEMLSLGSILVSSRTEELNIQIPAFCCHLSENIEKRKEMIQGFLKRALFELQDLAASPDIRDPSLNTAQCVIQGHKPKFSDTKGHIVKMSVVCSIFAMSAGFIFSWAMLNLSYMETTTAKAIRFSSSFLSVLCTFYFFVACVLAFHFSSVFFATLAFPIIWTVCESIFSTFIYRILSFSFRYRYVVICLLYTFGGNMICYISCWLVIGIRINPLWGLTVALSIISIFAAFTYAVYLHLEVKRTFSLPSDESLCDDFSSRVYVREARNDEDDRNRVLISLYWFLKLSQSFGVKFFCLRLCIAVGSFFVFVILAGPSIGGQTGADELLKTSSLYFITAFITWTTLRNTDHHSGGHRGKLRTPAFITGANLRNRAKLRNRASERPQNGELQDTDHHTGDHRGELGTLVKNYYYCETSV